MFSIPDPQGLISACCFNVNLLKYFWQVEVAWRININELQLSALHVQCLLHNLILVMMCISQILSVYRSYFQRGTYDSLRQ